MRQDTCGVVRRSTNTSARIFAEGGFPESQGVPARDRASLLRTCDGCEVDFFARDPEGKATLIQGCTDVSDPATCEREVRALSAAATEYRGALPLLLTFDTLPPRSPRPQPLRWQPAIAWLPGEENFRAIRA